MKIKKVILNNFRAYKGKNEIEIDDLTVFVGKNDVGKSTILEALDIFFNDSKGAIKLEKEDLNKQAEKEGENEITIGVVFSNHPKEIVVDSTVPTSLEDEYLLNKDSLFEIHKTYKNGKITSTKIVANHPVNDAIVGNLLLNKITELKEIIENNNLNCEDKRKSSLLRKAIRSSYPELKLEEKLIPVDQEGAKQIWDQLQKHIPVYALFHADRSNNDNDNEVQDPLKLAVKEILKKEEIQNKLQDVAKEVEEISSRVASSTLEKLQELNPDIAKQLKPNIPAASELKWYDVFKKISITSDDEIPLNKRGSGVRRLVLISFFGSEAERRMKEKGVSNVIYAIEEPETSQHPFHQRYLINSLVKLSQIGNTQIILTTHHPATAQLLPIDSLRLVKNDNGELSTSKDSQTLQEIADSLGVLPTIGKVVVCVEGENDRKFLLNISNIPELKSIINLKNKQVSIIPMCGANLKNWVNRNYLENSNVLEFHLYDKDSDEKYKNSIEEVNKRPDKSCGLLTCKSEIEDYVHKDLICNCEQFKEINFSEIKSWEASDVISFIASKTKLKEDDVKSIICGCVSKDITKKFLEDLGVWKEVEGWFKKTKELFESTIQS